MTATLHVHTEESSKMFQRNLPSPKDLLSTDVAKKNAFELKRKLQLRTSGLQQLYGNYRNGEVKEHLK